MSPRRKENSGKVLPYHRPEGAKESFVDIKGQRWIIWEFPFFHFKKLGSTKLKGSVGMTFYVERLIILDSMLENYEKDWALTHEMFHAMRWESGVEKPRVEDRLWNEIEVELMTIAAMKRKEGHAGFSQDMLDGLRLYLGSEASLHHEKAVRLANFLKENSVNAEEASQNQRVANIPEDTVGAS